MKQKRPLGLIMMVLVLAGCTRSHEGVSAMEMTMNGLEVADNGLSPAQVTEQISMLRKVILPPPGTAMAEVKIVFGEPTRVPGTDKGEALLKRLVAGGNFVKGSIGSVCGSCARSRCICAKACATKAFRLTYKDTRQKTHIVYIPRNRLAYMKRLIANYTRVRAHCFSGLSIPTLPFARQGGDSSGVTCG